jgi:hypothetical protein
LSLVIMFHPFVCSGCILSSVLEYNNVIQMEDHVNACGNKVSIQLKGFDDGTQWNNRSKVLFHRLSFLWVSKSEMFESGYQQCQKLHGIVNTQGPQLKS